MKIYLIARGRATVTTQPALRSQVQFQFCFSRSGVARPGVKLVIHRGREVPGAQVLYRRTMRQSTLSGGRSCFASTLRLAKRAAKGQDTATFTVFNGGAALIAFPRSFTVR